MPIDLEPHVAVTEYFADDLSTTYYPEACVAVCKQRGKVSTVNVFCGFNSIWIYLISFQLFCLFWIIHLSILCGGPAVFQFFSHLDLFLVIFLAV